MSNATEADSTQAAPAAESQADTSESTQAVEASGSDALPDWAQKELKALRKENETRRRAEKQRQESEMSDVQRTKAQLDELLTAHNTALGELRGLKAQGVARDAGAIYPDLVADRLSDDALTGDKQTRDRELDRIRKQYPSLFRSGSADGGAGRDAPQRPTTMNDLIRQTANKSG